MSLEFERKLVKVPHTHLRLVCASGDGMVAVARALDADARLWKLKVLNELYRTFDVFAKGALSLGLGCAFAHEPIWEGRGGSSDCAIDRVHFHHRRITFYLFIRFNLSSTWCHVKKSCISQVVQICGQTSQSASTVTSKPVKAMLITVPREARATPAFALLKWEPDPDGTVVDGPGTDPESCPDCPEPVFGWGTDVDCAVIDCDTGESGNADIAAAYSKYHNKCHEGGTV